MVFAESPPIPALKAPVPKLPLAVVVAADARVEFVPYAKPSVVAFDPPVAMMAPTRFAELRFTPVAEFVVTAGAPTVQLEVVNDCMEPRPVPKFVA